MSYDCPDFVQDASMLLEENGYTFHERYDEETDETLYWFCWAREGTDIECGEECPDALIATASAMKHWFDNAKILTCEEEDAIAEAEAA